MFLSYEQVTATASVKTVSALTVPGKAQFVTLQATENAINYTMDNSSNPTAGATGEGMRLLTTEPPAVFQIDDLRRIKFIRGAGADGKLNVHYGGGRDV